MSPALQGVVVGVLVLAATAYAAWRMGPASLRRRFRPGAKTADDSCSNCQASSAVQASKDAKMD
jgi:hypothetical protein